MNRRRFLFCFQLKGTVDVFFYKLFIYFNILKNYIQQFSAIWATNSDAPLIIYCEMFKQVKKNRKEKSFRLFVNIRMNIVLVHVKYDIHNSLCHL